MTNYIKNMPIKRRLYFSLFLFIILPFTLMVIFTYEYTGQLNREELYTNELESFTNRALDIEEIFDNTKSIESSAVTANPITRLFNGTATSQNYLDISHYFEDLITRYSYYENFAFSFNNEIIYQRGTHINSIDTDAILSLYTTDINYIWASPHLLSIPATNYDQTLNPVITYHSYVYDYSVDHDIAIGVFSISLNVDMLNTLYTTYLNPQSYSSTIINAEGIIMCSNNTEELGNTSNLYEQIKNDMDTTSDYMVLTYDSTKMVCYYYTDIESDFIYLNLVPYSAYNNLESALSIILGGSLIFFMLFGLSFSFLQRKYILTPINSLTHAISKVKEGDFGISLPYESKDELGQLSGDFIDMTHQLDSLINENYLVKLKRQEAEMSALVMQINPHFLYNTLDSIHWLAITEGAYDTSEQLETLSSIMKHMLNQGSDYVTLQDELSFIQSYLYIMNRRYGTRIQFEFDIEESLLSYRLLKLLMQPLIENAIVHGLEPQKKGGIIHISAYTDNDLLFIEVVDDGIGTDEVNIQMKLQSTNEEPTIFALKNIQERIHLHYGQEYGLSFHSQQGEGTTVILTLPYQES